VPGSTRIERDPLKLKICLQRRVSGPVRVFALPESRGEGGQGTFFTRVIDFFF
jgi:hypothetical protein